MYRPRTDIRTKSKRVNFVGIAKHTRVKKILLAFFSASILACFCFVLPRWQPHFFSFEHQYADWRTSLFSPGHDSNHKQILLVKIGEAELSRLVYRSPIDRRYLSDLVSAIDEHDPAVVALDILFDQETETDKDSALKSTVLESNAPVVLASADDRYDLRSDQRDYMQSFVKESGAQTGFVNLPTEEDDVVRELPVAVDPNYPVSFSDRVAEVFMGIKQPELSWKENISWLRTPRDGSSVFKEVPAGFYVSNPQVVRGWTKNKVVIVGTDLLNSDRHETPFSVLGRVKNDMAGMYVHAQVIAQRLDNRRLQMLPALYEVLSYFIIGVIGFSIADRSWRLLSKATTFSIVSFLSLCVDLILYKFASIVAPTAMFLVCFWIAIFSRGIFAKVRDAVTKYGLREKRVPTTPSL